MSNKECNCGCTGKATPMGYTGTSNDILYNGVATCTGFTSGNINDFITHITSIVCGIVASINNTVVDMSDVTIDGLDVSCLTAQLEDAENLEVVINVLIEIICEIKTYLANLSATDIATSVDFSCITGTPITNVEEALQALVDFVCGIETGASDTPLIPYVIDGITPVDISSVGVARVRMPAKDYWVNQRFTSLPQTDIDLNNTSDNYIFINSLTNDYEYTAVAIGNPTPATQGDLVALVRTGVGTITSINVIISDTPISGDLIADGSITADKIDEAGTFNPSIALSYGVYRVETQNSARLNPTTNRVELVNDENTPGASRYYGTSTAGVKGFHALPAREFNGAGTNVSAVGGVINCTGNFTSYHIVSTDGVDVDIITINPTDNKLVVISNNTGADMKFVTGGNINVTASLSTGQYMVAEFRNSSVFIITAVYTRGLLIESDTALSVFGRTFVGDLAGQNNIGGEMQVGIGYGSGAGASGSKNINIGDFAGFEATGNDNIHIGEYSGNNNSGSRCIGWGNDSLEANTEDDILDVKHSEGISLPGTPSAFQVKLTEGKFRQHLGGTTQDHVANTFAGRNSLSDGDSVTTLITGAGNFTITVYKTSDDSRVGSAVVDFNAVDDDCDIIVGHSDFSTIDEEAKFCLLMDANNVQFKNMLGYDVKYVLRGVEDENAAIII